MDKDGYGNGDEERGLVCQGFFVRGKWFALEIRSFAPDRKTQLDGAK